jgi:hypothetical protein
MRINPFLLVVPLLITGCGIKKALQKDPLYQRALVYTQRGQLSSSLETKALIDGVYLNPLYPGKFEKPTFLIGVYNDFDNNLTNPEFNITLNNQPPLEINSTIPPFVLYKNFPFYNTWMNYYLVKFPDTKFPYKLVYASKDWGSVVLTWNKPTGCFYVKEPEKDSK